MMHRRGTTACAALAVLVACALISEQAVLAGEVELTLVRYAARDTQVMEKYPDENFGTLPLIRVTSYHSGWEGGGDGRSRGLFAFDISGIPTQATVTGAHLELYQTDGIIYPDGFSVYAALGDWTEYGVNWDTQPDAGLYVGHLPNAILEYLVLDSTALASVAQQWIDGVRSNDGIKVQFVDEYHFGNPNGVRGDTFASRESMEWPHARLTLTVEVDAACLADLNGNGVVDQYDLGILLGWYGLGDGGDVDRDGDTDQNDLGILLSVYGQTCE
ncbi:MAG: DNRLRE domain-containing protein [Phycisphaerales bacterium]|nr:DNRLRE domain-containing protein [Phycisphaerales bacterium]